MYCFINIAQCLNTGEIFYKNTLDLMHYFIRDYK